MSPGKELPFVRFLGDTFSFVVFDSFSLSPGSLPSSTREQLQDKDSEEMQNSYTRKPLVILM